MANYFLYPLRGSKHREVVKLYGNVVIGSAGAVSSTDCKGFSVTKTSGETGRYSVALDEPFAKFLACQLTLEEVDDAAVTTIGGSVVRNVDVANSSSPGFDLQLLNASGADTNPASGTTLHLEITLQNTSED